MRPVSRFAAVAAVAVSLLASGLGLAAGPAAAAGTITCTIVAPGNPVVTSMDTPVAGKVACTHDLAEPVTLAVLPFKLDETGPFNGKLQFNTATGDFVYTPGFYPPDPLNNNRQDRLPEFTGPDAFTIQATSPSGAQTLFEVPILIQAAPRSCDASFTPTTRTMFNDPSGNESKQYQMLRYLIAMIDCTPATNPDGSQASIRFSFYSLTYAPVQAALSAAAARGVSVQALTNSHSDKYAAWRELTRTLGTDTRATNFTATCWQGCLTPRNPPTPGGPTAWYSADSTNLTGRTVVFTDRSIPGLNPIVRWQWDFGDGTTAEGPGPHAKVYPGDGTFATSLTVTDAAGVTHVVTGNKTIPDNMEPMYPSLHSKIYLFSTVGVGGNQRRWVSAYSSGNPTYQQARKGFNNMNIAVGDKAIYDIFDTYFRDMVRASRGELLTTNYFRTFSSPGNPETGARPTTVHLGPQTSGDINREILKSIQCKYKVGGKTRRTDIKVSMFVLTRRGVASDLWRLAMQKGCNVEIVYTQMSQRLKGPNGRWLENEDGEETGYGSADCLSTPPSKVIVTKASKGKPAKRRVVRNSLIGPDGPCSGGSLRGAVPVTSSGTWLNRKSPYGGGRLIVRMSCPVAPKYDPVKKIWAVMCIRNDIFTHQKVLLVNGFIRGSVQKYVMSGSSNWSSPGLRASDEVITEIQNAPALYAEHVANFQYLKKVVAKNSLKKRKRSSTAQTYMLQLSEGQQLDVRGMTDAQLQGQG
ncbi:MAG TPA: PKD domain-containing protein [Candidatus Nanopelagicales bacterium]